MAESKGENRQQVQSTVSLFRGRARKAPSPLFAASASGQRRVPRAILGRLAVVAALALPLPAAVTISGVTPAPASPQRIGTSITWTVTATDSGAGPLTFQFSVAPPGGTLALVNDFNAGTLSAGTWTAQPFVWVPTGIEGSYRVRVVAKDFASGESDSRTVTFQVNPLVTGSNPVVVKTANPLVALFSAPSCSAGNNMRVNFQERSKQMPGSHTNYMACHPPYTMTFEIAGMYADTTYDMFAHTTNGDNSPTLSFRTGTLPRNISFPSYTINIAPGPHTDTADGILLHNLTQFGGQPNYADVATDLSGQILWYYYAPPPQIITRPLQGGTLLTIETGTAWNPASNLLQLLRQIDLAGNTIRETNTGAIQQQLLALGSTDGGPCNAVPSPPPVGAACMGAFHHDAIQTLPNGYTALITDVEKIFPPGTQGDTSGLPVDIIGDMIVVLNTNWQVVWYFDAFQHDSGPPQLDIARPAVLGGTCGVREQGCPTAFLLGPGVAPAALDWLHGNSLYYWPQTGDLIWSSRNQDWVMKIDYNNGAGTGNILWRMGPCGDFKFNNTYNDPWPWFSAQHEVAMENNGVGPLSVFDNGNTRVSPPTGPGSSTGCMPGTGSGNSRGMALTVDEPSMVVTPVLSDNMGVFANSGGSAQLLSNGDYFFLPAVVVVSLTTEDSYFIEIYPAAGTDSGKQVLNIQGPQGYRGWQMQSLYDPPIS